jgi:hypothetical protein
VYVRTSTADTLLDCGVICYIVYPMINTQSQVMIHCKKGSGFTIPSRDVTNRTLPELIVLVDFKAIYPRVPRGYFRGFPWGGAFPKF